MHHVSHDFVDSKVRSFIRARNLIEPGSRVVVGVSGGADSTCLLLTLHSLRRELDIDLHIAHLDHRLRGEDSSRDAQFVDGIGLTLGLPCTVEARDVRAYSSARNLSLEEAAREVRYAFFAEVVSKVGARAVAVGHTIDDHIETILMHILRGAGLHGLQGLRPFVAMRTTSGPVNVLRPLLDVSRSETETYCRQSGLAPREDESNRSLEFSRNRVRLHLLPALRTYNPSVDDALARLAVIASSEEDFVDSAVEAAWGGVAWHVDQSIVLNRKGMSDLHPALKRGVLRKALGEFVPDLKDIEARHIDVLLAAVDAPSGKAFHLPGDVVFVTEYDKYVLGRNTDICPLPYLNSEFEVSVPGETAASGWIVNASVIDDFSPDLESDFIGAPTLLDSVGHRPSGIGDPAEFGVEYEAHMDFDKVAHTLTVRPKRTGDRFCPLGLGATKRVAEFMIDARIPRSWRKRIPMVTDGDAVIWVVGCRIDDRVRVTEYTKRILRLRFSRL